ncbi:hypothetical protein TEA_020369 [Camellia sinensis var. sinensis]|uniref:Uncharacterized protein n=1 Tax=Camellia sinensis var. sinensis TaxID=542762 RepID=A0A4S4F313_CAMSN|nr:hypothetical protein TEA_020369 [Camellia sinensis var. sinensis]
MDPNPNTFPILSYVMSKLPSIGPKHAAAMEFDIEQPPQAPPSSDGANSKEPLFDLADRMPRLTDPKVIASMRSAVSEVAQARSILKTLGDRPDHETVDTAKAKLVEIESRLSKQLGEIMLSSRPTDVDRLEWRSLLAGKEKDCRDAAEKERQVYKSVILLDQMHEAYGKLLNDSEAKLVKIYESAVAGRDMEEEEGEVVEEVNEEVVGILQEASGKEIGRIDLSGRRLRLLPEAFGRLRGLVVLNLSSNQLESYEALVRVQILVRIRYGYVNTAIRSGMDTPSNLDQFENQPLSMKMAKLRLNRLTEQPGDGPKELARLGQGKQAIPDSIGGLENLEELNLASNLLDSLPDSIGLLLNLKILNVSGNKLFALPDSICHCRSLVELDVSFNKLAYLPTNIGYELVNLRRLSVQLNKIRSLPTSIGEMRSLCVLDVHFNELRVLPLAIGRLTNLEILNLSSNFTDLTELPETIGDLTNLKELDLSNNQIQALPDTFGRLDNLTKLNLESNPLVIPPKEVVNLGVEAVKVFMA